MCPLSGYVAWVTEAFGPFWGFVEGFLSWISGVTDNAVYPVMFLTYLNAAWPDAGFMQYKTWVPCLSSPSSTPPPPPPPRFPNQHETLIHSQSQPHLHSSHQTQFPHLIYVSFAVLLYLHLSCALCRIIVSLLPSPSSTTHIRLPPPPPPPPTIFSTTNFIDQLAPHLPRYWII